MEEFCFICGIAFFISAFLFGKRLVCLVFKNTLDPLEIIAATALVSVAIITFEVWILASLNILSSLSLLAVQIFLTSVVCLSTRRYLPVSSGPQWDRPKYLETISLVWPAIIVSGFALLVVVAAAYVLPVWQWDSLAYHLPYVYFVIQGHGFSSVPSLVPYMSSYPHNIEYMMIAMRLFLPSNHYVNFAQIPFGLMGALAITCIAKRLGGQLAEALAAGALWLTLPAVFLQLPTTYIDVAVASYFLMAVFWILLPPRPGTIVLAGIALGLYLGSKPSAPLATMILFLVLFFRTRDAKLDQWLGFAFILILILGIEQYWVNFCLSGNPLWPVAVNFGPIHFPGPVTLKLLTSSGLSAPHPHGDLLHRVFESWGTVIGPPSYDMRLGGLGPLILFLIIPGALISGYKIFLEKERCEKWIILFALTASIIQPELSTVRFVLAFPGLMLALSAISVPRQPFYLRFGIITLASTLALWGLIFALPGFTGDCKLSAIWGKSVYEIRGLIGPADSSRPWIDLQERLEPQEVVASQRGFEFRGFLWRPDLRNKVIILPLEVSEKSLDRLIIEQHISYIVIEGDAHLHQIFQNHPERFRWVFSYYSGLCEVYKVINSNH